MTKISFHDQQEVCFYACRDSMYCRAVIGIEEPCEEFMDLYRAVIGEIRARDEREERYQREMATW